MSVKFCTKCGNKHDYTLEIPRFCSNCGNPFAGETAAAAKPIAQPVKANVSKFAPSRARPVIDGNGEEDADREVPQITEIQVEVEIAKPQRISFADAKNASGFSREQRTTQLSSQELEKDYDQLFQKDREAPKE